MNAHESSLSGYATGFAFLAPSDKLLDAEALTHYFASLTDSSDLRLRASALNGSWSYYSSQDMPQDRDAFAIVDHRSSHALYYRVEDGRIRICDNGFKLLHHDEPPIPTTKEDCLFFSEWGFTPEDHTLHPDIHRIPAGCGIHFKAATGVIETVRYDSCWYEGEPLSVSYTEAQDLFRATWHTAVQRMRAVLTGRPVILPLTAGRDSRLIALALKEIGITPITCTYGRTEDVYEVARAREIAQILDFPHRYLCTIPDGYGLDGYTADDNVLDYLRYISGLGSGYFFGGYSTARTLAKEYPTAIVLPGHNGDVIGGDNLHLRFFNGMRKDAKNARLLCFHEGGNRRLRYSEVHQLAKLHKQMFAQYPHVATGKDLFELFRNREIMPKYYINSSRGWRYFGLNVWMPFIDKELCHIMHRLPASYRIGKRLYEEVTDQLFQEAGIAFDDDVSMYKRYQQSSYRMKQWLRPYIMYLRTRIPHPLFSADDPLGFRELMSGALYQSVLRYVPWETTSTNGLSFAWWLWLHKCLS